MKLRIRDNSLRLRLSQSDLEAFKNQNRVEAEINFPGGSKMYYVLIWSENEQFQAAFDGDYMKVIMPKAVGEKWLAPNEVTIEHKLKLANKTELRLLIEKDFQCLIERTDEDETDMFANPNTNC